MYVVYQLSSYRYRCKRKTTQRLSQETNKQKKGWIRTTRDAMATKKNRNFCCCKHLNCAVRRNIPIWHIQRQRNNKQQQRHWISIFDRLAVRAATHFGPSNRRAVIMYWLIFECNLLLVVVVFLPSNYTPLELIYFFSPDVVVVARVNVWRKQVPAIGYQLLPICRCTFHSIFPR